MKLQQKINIEEVAKLTLRKIYYLQKVLFINIMKTKLKKNPFAKILIKAYYKLRIIKPKKGKGSYVRNNYNTRSNSD